MDWREESRVGREEGWMEGDKNESDEGRMK